MTGQPILQGGVADRHLMLAFEGTVSPRWVQESLAEGRPAGFSLFRGLNLETPEQTAALIDDLQTRNGDQLPLLVAIDQEGGQLQALPGSTPFAGNMALGAAGDEDLAYRVGEVIGTELAAVGVNVNYAPAVDVATLAGNPSLGVRSFGSDPAAVARLGSAVVRGMRAGGVLTTAKHYPGKGEAAVDPHYQLPHLDLTRDRLDRVELVPFAAVFGDGTPLAMVGHYLVPALTGSDSTPISVSAPGLQVMRDELGFDGVIITDALDMGALDQGAGQVVEFIAMANAGIDLFLVMPDPDLRARAILALDLGHARGLIPTSTLERSAERVARLRRSIPDAAVDPAVVGSDAHLAVARELADASINLIKDRDNLLLPDTYRSVLVFEPTPVNVTPADTMAHYPPVMGEELARLHPSVTSVVYPHEPSSSDVAGLVDLVGDQDLIVVGTVAANSGQAELVARLVATGKPVVAVALRTPFDLTTYPMVSTYICTYSSHRPSMAALARCLFAKQPFRGRLPVPIGDLYPVGHLQ